MESQVFDYYPQSTNSNGGLYFEGSVRLKVKPLLKRLELVEAEQNYEAQNPERKLSEKTQHYWSIVEENLESVDLVREGKEIKSLEDAQYYEGALNVVSEIYRVILNGVQLGNGLPPEFEPRCGPSKEGPGTKTMQ